MDVIQNDRFKCTGYLHMGPAIKLTKIILVRSSKYKNITHRRSNKNKKKFCIRDFQSPVSTYI
jgi:hypothetical protein